MSQSGRALRDVTVTSLRFILWFGGEGRKVFAAGPLANYQFAAMLLFENHRLFQCVNGTFSLLIGWGTRGHSLQPQSRRSHDREQGFPPFCREPDDLGRNARDYR